MGKIVLLMGKSASGKDFAMAKLLKENRFSLKPIIMHTTRPPRIGEVEGREYYFSTEEEMKNLEEKGKIIEQRKYDTIFGPWYYFTTNTHIDLENHNYLALNTLVGLDQYLRYYKKEEIVSILIDVEDGLRLTRALEREKRQQNPKYDELCRRFLADSSDFSKENIEKRQITSIIENNDSPDVLMDNLNKVLSLHL